MHTSADGSKRQLPPWMMPKVGVNNASNPDSVVETNCCVEKGNKITENAGNGTKENAGKGHKRETSKRKSNLNAKREVKRRRNSRQEDESGDSIIRKKKKKDDKSSDEIRKPSRKKQQNSEDPSLDSCHVCPVQASNDDDDYDVELTVEDLMAIAKQYVKDHEDKKRQETSTRKSESQRTFQAKGESGTTLDSSCDNTKPSSSSRETHCSSAPTTTGESIATSTSQSSHAVPDMLDMFFASLTKKPLEKVEETNKSIVDSLDFTHDFTRQSQHDTVGEEVVPLMKKRNTLKDKVAMFLD